ncbi:MAG: DUF3575 domain-containing protein [Prevotella sp.]
MSGKGCSTDSLSVQIFFRTNHSDIEPGFKCNQEHISRFFATFDSLAKAESVRIDSVVLVSSSASPEGSVKANDMLSRRRAASVETLFREHSKADVRFRIIARGEDWETLSALLRASKIQGKEKAIEVIENTPDWVFHKGSIVGSRKKSVMDMQGGVLWREMNKHIFPLLRQATLTVHYSSSAYEIQHGDTQVQEVREPDSLSSLPQSSFPAEEPISVSTEPLPLPGKPLCAVKTNLLADAATLVNIGIEIPVGERYSIAGMFYFPWWKSRANDITIQMLGGTLEGRYWLGNRSQKSLLTGFFAGIYGGAGYYDFQLGSLSNGDGVQGDFYVMGGISAGYAHRIGRRLRLEYSLGVGYLRSDYREYESVEGTKYGDIKVVEYPWEKKRISGFLPSKLEVSLVWLFSSRKGGTR